MPGHDNYQDPLNKQVMEVQLVPTTNVVLNFTARFTGKHGYDSELQAKAKVKEANGEAEGIRSIDRAKADAYQAGVNALGEQESQ